VLDASTGDLVIDNLPCFQAPGNAGGGGFGVPFAVRTYYNKEEKLDLLFVGINDLPSDDINKEIQVIDMSRYGF